MWRTYGIVAVTLISTGTTVIAQSADDVQRCIFSCLANFPGADNPEYNACVENICYAENTESAQQGAWAGTQIFPENPPYLDGRVASVTTRDGALSLSYICGRDGDSSMLIDGQVLASLGVLDGQGRSMLLTVDGTDAHWLAIFEYETALFVDLGADHPVLQSMMMGTELTIDLPGFSSSASLQGGAQAIGDALRFCQNI